MAREIKDSGIEWIGEIPKEWEIRNIKYLFSFGKGLNITKENLKEQGVAVISYGQIHSKLNPFYKLSDDLIRFVDESYLKTGNLSLVNQGDFIFADTSEDVQGCGNFIYVDGQQTMFAGYHTIILRSLAPKDNKFFAFLFMSDCWRKQIRECVNGVKLFSISQKLIKKTSILIPPEDEKVRIVNYLEEHCATIDNVLEKIRASIEEYKKLKQAIITQSVTKGIRGNREMKDSGIEWNSKIPVEWSSINPKALFRQRRDKAFEGEQQLTASQQYGIMYQNDYMKLTGTKVVTVEKDFDILKHVEAGDFVISMRSFQGGLEYSELSGSISSAYVMLVPNLESVYSRFYRWLLKSEVYIRALQSTSNMVRDGQAMRYSNFSQVRLYIVPMEEQEEIAQYLDKKCAVIDELIVKKEKYFSEIENYKKSLIYEYVTGKKEVAQNC